MSGETDLQALDALAGEWATEATHPAFPGTVVPGRATFEWLEGEKFLVWRSHHEHPQIPDAIAIIGVIDDELVLNYFDVRGVHRIYAVSSSDGVWRMHRDEPGFSQRFEGRFADGGRTIAGVWELSRDDATWDRDLAIDYRRVT